MIIDPQPRLHTPAHFPCVTPYLTLPSFHAASLTKFIHKLFPEAELLLNEEQQRIVDLSTATGASYHTGKSLHRGILEIGTHRDESARLRLAHHKVTIFVDDVDATAQCAMRFGATLVTEPEFSPLLHSDVAELKSPDGELFIALAQYRATDADVRVRNNESIPLLPPSFPVCFPHLPCDDPVATAEHLATGLRSIGEHASVVHTDADAKNVATKGSSALVMISPDGVILFERPRIPDSTDSMSSCVPAAHIYCRELNDGPVKAAFGAFEYISPCMQQSYGEIGCSLAIGKQMSHIYLAQYNNVWDEAVHPLAATPYRQNAERIFELKQGLLPGPLTPCSSARDGDGLICISEIPATHGAAGGVQHEAQGAIGGKAQDEVGGGAEGQDRGDAKSGDGGKLAVTPIGRYRPKHVETLSAKIIVRDASGLIDWLCGAIGCMLVEKMERDSVGMPGKVLHSVLRTPPTFEGIISVASTAQDDEAPASANVHIYCEDPKAAIERALLYKSTRAAASAKTETTVEQPAEQKQWGEVMGTIRHAPTGVKVGFNRYNGRFTEFMSGSDYERACLADGAKAKVAFAPPAGFGPTTLMLYATKDGTDSLATWYEEVLFGSGSGFKTKAVRVLNEPGFVVLKLPDNEGVLMLSDSPSGQTEKLLPSETHEMLVYVPNLAGVFEAARQDGACQVAASPHDKPWGEKSGRIVDPMGNRLTVSKATFELTPKFMQSPFVRDHVLGMAGNAEDESSAAHIDKRAKRDVNDDVVIGA
uniref:VOC domain-containing protein n=1 Tax=Chrysotila carterae TaxID=13221 RepID=A0A7S4C218_CHRCT|mmetsp:Transcript_13755/g.26858  ORF Transcript_13755/g.26858 Transcript_13755/m.26858 type:complete len:762 (+) Transcript_13755:169-2454(+)|eukprot:164571-Pleurochrysis_carterae.AAC.4